MFKKLFSKKHCYEELHARRNIANIIGTMADGYDNALEKVQNRVVRQQDKEKICKLIIYEIQNYARDFMKMYPIFKNNCDHGGLKILKNLNLRPNSKKHLLDINTKLNDMVVAKRNLG